MAFPRTAAMSLSGTQLTGGWTVTELIPKPDGSSAGNHSVSYHVEHESGSRGFLKALDYSSAFREDDPAPILKGMVDAYIHERELLACCSNRNLRHVVKAIGDGKTAVQGFETPVNYIIFERAAGDLQRNLMPWRPLMTLGDSIPYTKLRRHSSNSMEVVSLIRMSSLQT